MILLDTDVIVDLLRGYSSAMIWLGRASNGETLAASGYTAMECVSGCRNRQELQRLDALLREFDLLWLTQASCALALARYRDERLKHGAGIVDVLIAQTAIEYGLPIYTFNAKHYRHVRGLQVKAPYER